MWYNEIKSYNYAKSGFSGATGHFTQLVWKSTTSVGFGIQVESDSINARFVFFFTVRVLHCTFNVLKVSSDGTAFTGVASYAPAGNIVKKGSFTANVLPCSAVNPPVTTTTSATSTTFTKSRTSTSTMTTKLSTAQSSTRCRCA